MSLTVEKLAYAVTKSDSEPSRWERDEIRSKDMMKVYEDERQRNCMITVTSKAPKNFPSIILVFVALTRTVTAGVLFVALLKLARLFKE